MVRVRVRRSSGRRDRVSDIECCSSYHHHHDDIVMRISGELRCCDDAETETCRRSCRQSLMTTSSTSNTSGTSGTSHVSEDDALTLIIRHCGHIDYSVRKAAFTQAQHVLV